MEHKTFAKRLLALCLTLIILVGILPANVFARDFTRSSSEDLAYNAEPQRRSVKNLLLKRLLGGADAVDETLASKPNYWSQAQALNTQGLETYPAIAGEELDPGALGYPTALPGTSGRATDQDGNPGIEWDSHSGTKDDGSSLWPLPSGVRFINGYNGSDPLNTFGFSYSGRYLDHKGRTVLKFDLGNRNGAVSGVWKNYVMRFPKEMFNSIVKEDSYYITKNYEYGNPSIYGPLKQSVVPGQTAYALQFPYLKVGAGYTRTEIHVVLNKLDTSDPNYIDWEKKLNDEPQVVQLRLFDGIGYKIFSTSKQRNYQNIGNFGYNSHTKSAVVGGRSLRPSDLIESTMKSGLDGLNDAFHTADSSLELDKENGKVRILYTFAKGQYSLTKEGTIGDEPVAIRQTLDPEFVRLLKLDNQNGKIGSMQIFAGNGDAYGDKVDIFQYNIQGAQRDKSGNLVLDEGNNVTPTREDKSIFLQFNSQKYNYKDNAPSNDPEYVQTIATGSSSKNVYFRADTTECASILFEYDIDPAKISAAMIKDNVFSKNYVFDTRYMMATSEGVYKFEFTAPENIVYGPDKYNFFRFSFPKKVSLSDGVGTEANRRQDFVMNIGGKDGIWKSWKRGGRAWIKEYPGYSYCISPYYNEVQTLGEFDPKIGGTIKKGTKITVYYPTNIADPGNEIKFDIVKVSSNSGARELVNPTSLTGGKKYVMKKVENPRAKNRANKYVWYPPMYIKYSVSTVGGSAVREQYQPIVDEIFTDAKEFTGIARTEGGVFSMLHANEEVQSGNAKYMQLRQYLGTSWLESTSDKNGDPDYYYRSDGKDAPKKIEAAKVADYFSSRRMMGHDENNQLVSKVYKGYNFSIANIYSGEENGKPVDVLSKTKNASKVEKVNLVKDQPVSFSTYKNTSLRSDPVYEQVQAKVTFKVYDNKEITKIVPLNKEYSVTPLKVTYKEDKNKKKYAEWNTDEAGKPNQNYKGNGFLTKDDNIRIDKNVEKVEIERTAYSYTNQGKTLNEKQQTEKYLNYLNHNGYPYDINNKDPEIAQSEKNRLIERIFPDARYDVSLTQTDNGKKRNDDAVVIGWTTKKLEGNSLQQMDAFYKLKEGTKDNKEAYTIRSIDDWKKVDAENADTYIFDEYSPVDKNRTVYAVWGTPCLILHPNNTDGSEAEKTVRIPIRRDMMEYTDEAIDKLVQEDIDVITKATENAPTEGEEPKTPSQTGTKKSLDEVKKDYHKEVIVISNIPKAPYRYNKPDDKDVDPELRHFTKTGQTFVGWRAVKDPDAPREKIQEELDKFDAGLQNSRLSYFLNSEALKATERYGYILSKYTSYLPNGYKLWISAKDLGLHEREEFFTKVKDIHLYAMYRPYFNVQVDPGYGFIDRTDAKDPSKIDSKNIQYGDFGKYGPYNGNKRALNIGLITRTAVTPYTAPTVAQNATYNPIGDILDNQTLIQKWDPNQPNKKPTWILPGYDEIGRRKSYVSVIIPDGKNEDGIDFRTAYENFGADFTEQSWKKLGITTYLKLSGTSIDPSSPRNIHEWVHNDKELGDKYGDALAKKQSFTMKDGNKVDIFTAATSRISTLVPGKKEISGYRIQLTASPEEIPTPQFERIRDRDTEIKLGWPGNGHTSREYLDINKLKFTAQYITGDLKDVGYKEFSFTRRDKNSPFVNDVTGSPLKAEIKDDKLVFTGLSLKDTLGINTTDEKGQPIVKTGTLSNITVKYIKETLVENKTKQIETSATEAIVPVKTSKPVIQMNQTYRADPTNKVKIEFVVPSALLDQVRRGSKYIAQKWIPDTNHPNGGTWVDVGTRILTRGDLINNGYQGNTYAIDLDEGVQDGNIIRIKSMEYNPDATDEAPKTFYNAQEKAAGAEEGFSLPNYSTRIQKNKDETEPNVDGAPIVGAYAEGKEYVTLDLKAPEFKDTPKAEAKDETFRRTIDLTATFNEKLKDLRGRKEGERIKVEFGTKGPRGTEGNIIKYFESPNDLLDEVGVVERTPEMEGPEGKGLTGIWVSVEDEFGNATLEKDSQGPTDEGKLNYTQSYQLRVAVKGERIGRSWIKIKSEKANTKITITINKKDGSSFTQTETLADADTFYKVTLKDGGNDYNLQKGDEIDIKGESGPDADNKTYTTNPFIITMR